MKNTGVSQVLWRIHDYASDLLVPKLHSGNIMNKINLIDNVCGESKAVLNITLYFTRLWLFAVNLKVFGSKE